MSTALHGEFLTTGPPEKPCVWLLLCNVMLVYSPIIFCTIVDHLFSAVKCMLLCEYTGIYLSNVMGIWVVSCKSIMNRSAVNILIHVFSEIDTFVFDIYLRVVLVNHWKYACFTLVGKCHIIFQNGCNHFHSHQQSWRVSFAPYTCWILSVFLHLLSVLRRFFFPH